MSSTEHTTPPQDTPDAPPALRVEHAYKVFGRRGKEVVRRLIQGASRDELKDLGTAAVIDATFEVRPGEIFVVMGLSGSGKSTLIRMLNGLWPATTGAIYIGEENLADASPATLREIRRRRVSMVFQHFALLPHRTVLENAAYPLEIQGVPLPERTERAARSLALVGLDGWEDSLPGALSGGMRQRVGLARALTADTDILLMDEAFSALDPLIRREMQEQLLALQVRLGKTIVFITHDLNEAMFLGDRIAMMRDGRIVQVGTADEILSDPATDYVAQFVSDVDRTRVLTVRSVTRPARAVIGPNAGPRAALRQMEEDQVSAVFVVDRHRRLLGAVQDEDALRAVREGERELTAIMREETRAVHVDARLVEVLAPAAESRLPVPVIDDDGQLVGVVPRARLLAALAPSATEEAALREVSATADRAVARDDEEAAR